MEKTNRPQNFMDRHDNDDELFWEELGRLWRSQPVPPIPDPPRARVSPLRYAAGIAVLLLLGAVSYSMAPAADIAAINTGSLFHYAEVNATLTQTLLQR